MSYDPRGKADTGLRAVVMLGCFAFAASMAGCMANNVAANNAAERKAAEMSPPFLRAPGSPIVHVEKPTPKTSPKTAKVEVYGGGFDTIDNPPATDAPEVLLLAAIGWGEARGECKGGSDKCLAAVMHVALNRLSAGKWGDTLEDVVFAPKQFSALNQNDVNLRLIARMALTDGDKDWQRCKDVARRVLAGEIKDPTAGSLFYHEESISPRWNRQMKRVARIGKHVFWKG